MSRYPLLRPPARKSPDDQGDEGEGAAPLHELEGRRMRGREVDGERRAKGDEDGVESRCL